MVNKHRNECSITLAGKPYTLRASLELLEEYESRFSELKLQTSSFYRIAGFLVSKAESGLSEDEASKAYFNAGLQSAQDTIDQFLKVAYKTGDEEKPGKQEKVEV